MKQNRSIQDGLRKWINGNIRAKEEAQLDQLSREDDFARDAMEGFRSFADADHSQNLDRLRKQLQQKEKSAVIIPIMLRRIAAAVLFLVVVGISWWLNRPNQTGNLTMDQATESKTEEIAADPATLEEKVTEEVVAALDEEEVQAEIIPAPKASTVQPKPAAPQQPEPAQVPDRTSELAVIEEVEAEIDVTADEIPPPVTAPQREIVEYRAKSQPAAGAADQVTQRLPQNYSDLPVQMITGKVLDAEGQPVAGALIRDLANQQETRTDFAGNFSIQQALTGKAVDFQISHFNYADTTLELDIGQGLEINLQNKIKALSNTNSVRQPYPMGGFGYFQDESVNKKDQKSARKSNSPASFNAS
ncbi:MAG: carboxypeptidase-like regulatory domain-containing protein, partial [Bacteroidota bacterium]